MWNKQSKSALSYVDGRQKVALAQAGGRSRGSKLDTSRDVPDQIFRDEKHCRVSPH